ncbi:MAG TPA: HIT family protein [Cytophagales bacterium]|nr:HIT family protein [Cytophagales bacterium]
MTIFSKIISGEIPSYKIAEDAYHYAFLDIHPLTEGHTLVVPKKEVDYIFDLDDDALASLHIFSKKVANALRQAIPCKRIGIAVIGLEVPHAHIHLVPLHSAHDIDFSKPKIKYTQEDFLAISAKIKQHI